MNNYISIREILDNTLEHPLLKDVSFERAVNHAIHFMRIMGMPDIFLEKTEVIDIENYRGALPCDFYKMIQVRKVGHNNHYTVFRYSTDSFHMSDGKVDSFDLTYKLQGNVIFTSMKDGKIEIAYNAIALDNEGYPLIPDNSSFIRALELYIKKERFTVLFDEGKINIQVLNNTLQDYSWYVGQAQTSMIKPTYDQMIAISNRLNALVPRMSEHRSAYINSGSQEKIRKH